MRKSVVLIPYLVLSLFLPVNNAYAEDQSFADQFLGSPLLILVTVFIVVFIAFVYHKLRK